ncbi:aspartic proteinase 36-like [Primulina huaijiensis]|uniref:aspartic proteinase 36-like n=1 Tax=Primulina huaijiensis TaxID=1492673 RepID=UPI003CC6EE8E
MGSISYFLAYSPQKLMSVISDMMNHHREAKPDTEYCIGWQNSEMQTKNGKEITILGDLALSDKLILYDLENQTIGWTQYNCSSSIKLNDDVTGNTYAVAAHNISAAFNMSGMNFLSFFLLIAALLNLIE